MPVPPHIAVAARVQLCRPSPAHASPGAGPACGQVSKFKGKGANPTGGHARIAAKKKPAHGGLRSQRRAPRNAIARTFRGCPQALASRCQSWWQGAGARADRPGLCWPAAAYRLAVRFQPLRPGLAHTASEYPLPPAGLAARSQSCPRWLWRQPVRSGGEAGAVGGTTGARDTAGGLLAADRGRAEDPDGQGRGAGDHRHHAL